MLVPRPLASAAAGVQDPAAALPHAPFPGVDSVVVQSPVPGPIGAMFRFLFSSVPQSVQIAGALLGMAVGLAVLVLLWRRRARILQWVRTRSRRLQWALAAGLFLALLGSAGAGAATWNYTQHNNDFCLGCHVMDPAFREFTAHEDKHDDLECHDCHQQPVTASLRQLYLWVAERPDEIGAHTRLANDVCERCHVTGEAERWQRIASTAGHRVHLESDSTALRDMQCVTCHGEEVHRFVPANVTCGQSGCHEESQTDIVLGRMADQTALHCNACHRFTAEVPALATTDSARGTLVPGSRQCFGCHEMRQVLEGFDLARDPHGGTCGTCHNPHTQETPAAAVTTCASAQCHADWRQEPFHVGDAHRRIGQECLLCHQPHQSGVDASDCEGCHQSVRERTSRSPPVPFDTNRALRTIPPPPPAPAPNPEPPPGTRGGADRTPGERSSGVLFRLVSGSVPSGFGPPRPVPDVPVFDQAPSAQDSFPHAPHRRFACIECHVTGRGEGRLTFEPPRGCDICHHQAPATSRCATCHKPGEIEPVHQASLTVTVPTNPPRTRQAPFSHVAHAATPCVQCHTTPVSMAAAAAVAECRSCHQEHHTASRECASCHRAGDLQASHKDDPVASHQRCDACHTRATVALLAPTRPFCITCHEPQGTDHYDARECTICHFLQEPAAFKPRLLRPPV